MAVNRTSRTDRDSRLDEAIAEYLEAVDAGQRPAAADWLARFPDLAPDLERFFGEQDQVHKLLGALGTTPRAVDETLLVPQPTASATGALPSFGDYELLEEIARGGMGIVYRARQRSLNRIVAVKMILAG